MDHPNTLKYFLKGLNNIKRLSLCLSLLSLIYLVGCSCTNIAPNATNIFNSAHFTDETLCEKVPVLDSQDTTDILLDQMRSFYSNKQFVLKVLVGRQMEDGLVKAKLYYSFSEESNFSLYESFTLDYGAPYINYEKFVDLLYRDINEDGLDELILLATYSTGIGPKGSIPNLYALIFDVEMDTVSFNSILTDRFLEADEDDLYDLIP